MKKIKKKFNFGTIFSYIIKELIKQTVMKKIILTLIITFISISLFSQSTQLDFTMQLQNTNNNQALIYPNPTYNNMFKVKSNSVITNIEVMNLLGKSIYSEHYESYSFDEIVVQLPQCEKGIYMIKITFDDGETLIKKLLYQ